MIERAAGHRKHSPIVKLALDFGEPLDLKILLLSKRRIRKRGHEPIMAPPAQTIQDAHRPIESRMKSIARLISSLPLATVLWSQAPTFEVASIKPLAPSGDNRIPGQMLRDPGRVSYHSVTLQNLLAQAYRIKNFQISGPTWVDSDRFDIVAKLRQETHDDQLPAMLQALLKERFQLAFHREPKSMSAYVLLPGKGGPKLRATDAEPGGVQTNMGATRRHLSGRVSMVGFAGLLSNMLDRPVVDKTELKGVYDVDLEWSVDDVPDRTVQANDPPSLFTALQEKLGLRLDTRRTPVDLFVIDHVERVPTEN